MDKKFDKLASSFSMADASRIKGLMIWSTNAPEIKKNPDRLYVKCVVLQGSNENQLKVRQVDPPCDEEFYITKSEALNCNQNIDPLTYGDIGSIPHTNPACVLDFLCVRFMKKYIYTTVEPLLVVLNPFMDLKNTTDEIIQKYRDASTNDMLAPHVFKTARFALENLHSLEKSQSLIVSGESGAGKTEATKHIMRFFASSKTGGRDDTRIQEAVLAANPFLEAFGNAKTIRNNNSSRFGRFMQLVVAPTGGIKNATIQSFLLEKSRIVTQSDDERNYHIFYQLIKGSDATTKKKYSINGLGDYKFLNTRCSEVPGMDDVEEWNLVLKFFESIKLSSDTIQSIISLLSGVLHLGNVEIIGSDKSDIKNKDVFKLACDLLFIDSAKTEDNLLYKFSHIGKEVIKGNWSQNDSNVLRLSIAKAVYERLFFYIIQKLNKTIEPEDEFKLFVGMLDIFGFEIFKENSLEQLFINITNELLQQNFINTVFERETKLYQSEGINFSNLKWTTNIEIIDVLMNKKPSLMSLLEDQCLVAGCVDEKFLSSAYDALKNSQIFVKAKVQPNVNFIINHTIGPILYSCKDFLSKNKDILRCEITELFQNSNNSLAADLFAGIVIERGKLAKGQLIGSQFMKQLRDLISIINTTEPHYIRCVKPNEQKKALVFDNAKVLIQLHALSILEALSLRNFGYAYRRPFDEFVKQFRYISSAATKMVKSDAKAAAELLVSSVRAGQNAVRFGKTMIFMTNQALKELEKQQREAISHYVPLVEILEPMIARKMRKAKIDSSLPGLIRLQAHIRRVLAT